MKRTEFEINVGRFNRARWNLLAVVVITTINFFLLYAGTDYYLLFSALIPVVCFYWGVVEAVLSVAMLAAYLLCFLLSARKRVFMLVALILFIIDCLFLTYLIYFLGIGDFWLEVFFHAWIMFYLVTGVIAWIKIRGRDAHGRKPGEETPSDYGKSGYGAMTKDDIAKQNYPDRFVVRLMLLIPILGFAFIGIGVISSFDAWAAILAQGGSLSGLSENDSFGLTFGTICIICSGFFTFTFLRWRMVVTKGKIVFTPGLGKTRTIPLTDVRHIKPNSAPGYAAYDKGDKKLFSVIVYHRGYDLLAKAISPHINNPGMIPFALFHVQRKITAHEDGGEYLRGERAGDIVWFLREYSDHETDKEVLVSCKSCGLDNFALSVDAVEGAVEVECTYCNEKRLLLDSEAAWEDCEPKKIECPECGSGSFNAGVGFVHRRDGDVSRVYIGARCSNCGLLGCPADWEIDYSPTDEMERNV